MEQRQIRAFVFGVVLGVVISLPLYSQSFISWTKNQVIPVVLLKPTIGGFAPVEGSSIGNTWRKDEVVPWLK